MKQTLTDHIRENEDLRKVLLAQDGGIMKYWAEHPEADFDTDLFEGYEKQIEEDFIRANKQNRAVRSMMHNQLRQKALDWHQQSKGSELKFFVAIKPMLNTIDTELAVEAFNHIDIYMSDAYKESHRRKYPEGMPPQDFYNNVLEIFGPFGLALDCLERVLQEYRGKAVSITVKHFFQTVIIHQGDSPEWEETNNLQTEFGMRMFIETYMVDGGFRKMRQAVKEMIINSTKNLTEEERRKAYRDIARDEMMKVNQFTRWVNNETYPMEELEGGKFVPLITPEERHWLQNIMYKNSPGATGKQKLTTMGRNYSHFIHILQDIGRIWAAQLLAHGIDMKELEKETGIILSRLPDSMYYVDRNIDDRRGDCCVYDMKEAGELLNKIKTKEKKPVATTKQGGKTVNKAEKKKKRKEKIISPPAEYLTLKYFREGKVKRIQTKRVSLLYEKWQTGNVKSSKGGCWGWLPADVELEDFTHFFKGENRACNLKFAKNKTIISVFLNWLLIYQYRTENRNEWDYLIEHQTNQSASKLVREQFNATPNFDIKRLTSTDIARIKESIYILDYNAMLPPLTGGGDNDYDKSDNAIQQFSSNLELGIAADADVEQATKSQVLRIRKQI